MNKALYPNVDEDANHGQLYIIESDQAVDLRMKNKNNTKIEKDLFKKGEKIIRDNNPFVKTFNMMKEELDKAEEIAKKNGTDVPEMKLMFSNNKSLDQNTYNKPKGNEIAIIYEPDADGNPPQGNIVIHERGKQVEIIKSTDKNVDNFTYPLFFPCGINGWHTNLKSKNLNKKGRVTRAQYYKYLLALRENEFNPIHWGRSLSQQFIVDDFVKYENDQMQWIKDNQKQLKSDLYTNVLDWIKKTANENDKEIGSFYVLPSTHTGSPRYMHKNYVETMAMITQICKGRCDLFLTMTCNPKWKNIEENLYPGQTASDRFDIICEVFELKKDSLIEDIVKGELFGEVLAYVYVIEFQKRTLPHMHLMITLKKSMTDINEIDKHIQAFIPDKDSDPILYDIVTKHMIHGVCGKKNENAPCMRQNKCRAKYPKLFANETTFNENGYPNYKRPDNGKTVENHGIVLDNRNVVPYNPKLLKKYNCHINVEHVHSIDSISYLYQYMYKGPDKAEIEITEIDSNNNAKKIFNLNEMKLYRDMRFVGPTDAYYRIYMKTMHEKNYSVTTLPIHLENMQNITIPDKATINEIEKLAHDKMTMLMAYFELNKRNAIGYGGKRARDLLYYEIPRYFVFNGKEWKIREKFNNSIGTIQPAQPSQGERFYLRILLSHVKGADSFDYLKEFDHIKYNTYQETCLARNLIRDDSEWINCMNEALTYQTPSALRSLFVLILIHCNPTKPFELYEKYKDDLARDYIYRLKNYDLAIRSFT